MYKCTPMHKIFISLFFISIFLDSYSQQTVPLVSQVHTLSTLSASKTKAGESKLLFDGSGKILSQHTLKTYSINGKKKLGFHELENGDELFFIIKSGPVNVTLNNHIQALDKGSVVFVLPGDNVEFTNTHLDPVEIYAMTVRSSTPDQVRGRNAGNSFMMNWFDMVYKPHDKGGVRQLFDRKTIMLNRFDIHITSLNPATSSHPAHTHMNEEIILMLDGEGEMILGDKKQKITTGDAAWVESMIPHNFTNTASRPAVYFAIQWN